MKLIEYQQAAENTAVYPRQNLVSGLSYAVLGMVGEAGEVANKVKKVLRDSRGVVTDEVRRQLLDELGDTLWYVAMTARELSSTLEEVAIVNLEKLARRKEAGTLRGSGDNR